MEELVRFLVRFVYTKAHVLAPAIKHHAASDTRLNSIFHGLTRCGSLSLAFLCNPHE